jgi:hypothetical protein
LQNKRVLKESGFKQINIFKAQEETVDRKQEILERLERTRNLSKKLYSENQEKINPSKRTFLQ